VLTLLELLQARPGLRGAELAERLGVDQRTVRRDAVRLAELGIPVVAERGRYGGYRLGPGYKLPPLMLDDEEAAAVVLGLTAAGRLGLAPAGTAVDRALAKVTRVLPPALRDKVGALRDQVGFTTPAPDRPAPAAGIVLTLADAAGHRRRVKLRYRNWRGTESERELDPHGLVVVSGRWYVSGHDHASGQVRTFRVDRVLDARPTGGTFPDPGADPVARVTESLAAVPYAHRVEVVLETTVAEAARRIPPTVATLTQVDGGVLVSARAERLDGMAAMLAGLGWPFTVREPDELRDEVAALAGRLTRWAAVSPSRPPG
jgi:predicted DNA-binding transcriptional regulator YafY